MTDVFISYAREDQATARLVAAEVIRLGYHVWWDDQLPAHRNYGDVIAERIVAAKAMIVLWSRHAVDSEWVRAEANRGREARKLIQAAIDAVPPPIPFDQVQVASLAGWRGEPDHPGWQRVRESLAALAPIDSAAPEGALEAPPAPPELHPAPPPVSASPPPLAPPVARSSSLGFPAILACLIALLLLVALAIGMLTFPAQSPEPPRRPGRTAGAPPATGGETKAVPAEPQDGQGLGEIANGFVTVAARDSDSAGQGAATQRTVTLRNRSGHRVVALHVWQSNDADRGPNRMSRNGLSNGQDLRIVFDIDPDQCSWNVHIGYDDRGVAALNGIDLCRATAPSLTLHPD